MRLFIRTVLLALLFIAVLLTYKTVDADDKVDCNYMPNIERFAICSTYNTWGYGQYNSLHTIIERESGWNNTAQNPSSTAYGLGQFLNSTWGLGSYEKTSNPQVQILAMVEYVEVRYNTPTKALYYWKTNHHY